jgi:hypothetical protein
MANEQFNKLIQKLNVPVVAISKVPLITSLILLLLAVLSHRSPGFQTLMKFVVCGSAGYMAYLTKGKKNEYWMWGLILLAILFNPIAPILMDRSVRVLLYLVTAFVFYMILYVRYYRKD